MEKRASNTFVGGLNTDRNPLTAQNTELIEARNIDLLAVGEGYQLILQKREGNEELLKTHEYTAVWDAGTEYTIGTFVLYNENVYEALSTNTGNNPESSPIQWDLQALEPAGLSDGFIPLAVKEFNNVAYIVAVNPTTGEGEVGTFPSPDYDDYIYVEGAEVPGVTTIGTAVWDPTAVSADYMFTITPVSGSGTEEIVSPTASADFQLTKAGFTITNTGVQQDTYDITTTTGGVDIYVDGVIFTPGVTTPPTLSNLQTAVVTFKVSDPWAVTPEVIYYPEVTITSQDSDPTLEEDYLYRYSVPTAFQVIRDGTWSAEEPDDWSNGTQDFIDGAGTTAEYTWRSNNTGLTASIDSLTEVPDEGLVQAYSLVSNDIEMTIFENFSVNEVVITYTIDGDYVDKNDAPQTLQIIMIIDVASGDGGGAD